MRPRTQCDDYEQRSPIEQDEEPKTYMEPCNNEIPEYMELEPIESGDVTA